MLSIIVLALSHLAWAAKPASSSSPQSNIILAAQLGPYPVSIYEHEVKTSRPDPLAPTVQPRRFMITVYRPFLDDFSCPLEHQSHVPYAPPVVAAAVFKLLPLDPSSSNASSILAPVHLVNCSRPVTSSSSPGPLLLFSPGYKGTHHFYASTLQAAASSGYTVVAIDHTYEAAAVVFPDGSVAYSSAATDAYVESGLDGINVLQAIRVADTVSVLDAIERGDVPSLGGHSNTSSGTNSTSTSSSTPLRAVMYGHSFGGSTAANVAASDSRVLAAANIDGIFYGPVANGTVHKPLLMMASTPQDVATDWPVFYPAHVRGWKTWVRPSGAAHYSYTDLPLLADLLSLRDTVMPQDLTGTVDGRRLQEIVWRYTLQFFAYVLRDATPDLLNEPSAEFPDVELVEHAEAKMGQ